MNKKFKVLALMLSVTMLICAMPMMGFAAVSDTNPIEISSISIAKNADPTLLDVVVNYAVYDGFGDQVTVLATADSNTVETDTVTGEVTNVVYIDQVAKPALEADRKFSFTVAAADFATNGTLYVKVGGTNVTIPGGNNESIPSDGISTSVTINMCNPFGIANSGIVTVDNSVALVDATMKKITIGGTVLYYNQARNKYVGIVRTPVVATDAVVSDGASESLTYGMVNADTEINPLDANSVINIYLGSVSGTDKQLLAADVNDDKEVTPLDANSIINRYLESISKFAIEDK